ncbi:helicase HerA-like domain-containing protein [Candidatus Symbiobacter mobilis]|uniref:ATPase-like protein n=1 Tax=Candidatus Symbiobacter mobilis CR TaxID=946483 RepID=U5N666_9BURK|nr:helicase HerA-like domain-containing protein [Candidatus Symbiobacter mobilis]AGX86837.1 ATPase-like protein [Candidatus Symbiobacter mobilis CR]
MAISLFIAQNTLAQAHLLADKANRHGLITGATGTGKTVTLQALAEGFAKLGTPVFLADIKGDLTGICQPGSPSTKMLDLLAQRGMQPREPEGFATTLWDVFGDQGHPVRATVSDFGALLLSRMLQLNETQTGVLHLVFQIADDAGLLLLDLKDLRAMCQHVGDNASQFTTEYGNISAASIGAIVRGLAQLEQQGGDRFFGEPMLNIMDLVQTDTQGRGVINILTADKLMQSPRLYAAFLLWLLSELFETLPEVGDLDRPKLVFFFDEAHLLFADAPKVLVERIELVVRLIRSKGVGVYFVTQNPADIPDSVLGQLGNRIQHALRAYTPRDQKAVAAAASTMRPSPGLDVAAAITELAVGEALVSLLDDQGRPCPTQRMAILPPASQIGPITPAQRQELLAQSLVAGVYEQTLDRESAFEALRGRVARASRPTAPASSSTRGEPTAQQTGGLLDGIGATLGGLVTGGGGRRTSAGEQLFRSAASAVGRELGRQLIRGVLGSLLGGGRR